MPSTRAPRASTWSRRSRSTWTRRGCVRFTGGFNENRTKVLSVDPTPPQLAAVASSLFDRTEKRANRGRAAASSDIAHHDVRREPTRPDGAHEPYGKIASRPSATNPASDQVFQAKWLTDLSVSYKVMNQLTLAVSGTNIFDVYPDTNITPNQTRGIYLYSGLTPFGFNGAFWSVRATYEFARLPFLSRGRAAAPRKSRRSKSVGAVDCITTEAQEAQERRTGAAPVRRSLCLCASVVMQSAPPPRSRAASPPLHRSRPSESGARARRGARRSCRRPLRRCGPSS